MSLRSKIVIILCVVVGVYATTDLVIQRMTVSQGFLELEREEAAEDLERVIEALWDEVDELDSLCLDWSSWDDTYAFVADPGPIYEASNLGRTSLNNNGIDLLFICDTEGQVVWGEVVDPDTGENVRLREFPTQQWLPAHPLLVGYLPEGGDGPDEHPAGLWQTEHKPLLVSARPILTSEQDGRPRGTVVVGRFLAGDLDRRLSEQTRVDFDFWPLDGRPLDGIDQELIDEVTASSRSVIRERDDAIVDVYATFPDVRKNTALLVRANVDRKISRTGAESVRYALISTIAAGLMILLAQLGLIQKTVLTPLSALTRHTVRIGRNEDFNAKLDLQRDDEVGILAREFDDMMVKLEQSRAALVETARAAGMSEIATGILHNVGNVLNSVNISATMVSQKVGEMGVADLEKLADIITKHADDLGSFVTKDPKGKHLQPYFCALTEHLTKQQASIVDEIDSLAGGIDHIRELIKSQQSFAVKSDLVELTSLADRFDEALSITNKAITHDETLEVIREYSDVPPILVDKHKLLEILVNLIQNARQAMDIVDTGNKRLTLAIREASDGSVEMGVCDTGIGISEDNLVKVFNLGFTTRSSGHGYGLHTAANAATELGGALTAHSDGRGKGAAFTLRIPKKVVERVGELS